MAHYHYLAERIAELTGAEVKVLYTRSVTSDRPVKVLQRYALKMVRNGFDHVFWRRGIPVAQFTLNLATLCDMIEMGFIPVDKDKVYESQVPAAAIGEGVLQG